MADAAEDSLGLKTTKKRQRGGSCLPPPVCPEAGDQSPWVTPRPSFVPGGKSHPYHGRQRQRQDESAEGNPAKSPLPTTALPHPFLVASPQSAALLLGARALSRCLVWSPQFVALCLYGRKHPSLPRSLGVHVFSLHPQENYQHR